MMKVLSPWTWVLAFSALVAGLTALPANGSPLRAAVVLWFLLVCPGMVAVRFFRLGEPLLEWIVAIVVSVAADTFIAGILLYAGRWSPLAAFAILSAFTIGGAIVYDLAPLRQEGAQWIKNTRAWHVGLAALFARLSSVRAHRAYRAARNLPRSILKRATTSRKQIDARAIGDLSSPTGTPQFSPGISPADE